MLLGKSIEVSQLLYIVSKLIYFTYENPLRPTFIRGYDPFTSSLPARHPSIQTQVHLNMVCKKGPIVGSGHEAVSVIP